jgi:uncharacterized membrane protein YsdA (DUF1294 family)
MATYRNFALAAIVLGAALVVALGLLLRGHWYLDWLLGWSATAFLAYGWDKRQAIRGGVRVPEIVLHGLALVGGVLGAWAGRAYFRHKTLRTDFLVVLVIATVLHASFLVWILATQRPL